MGLSLDEKAERLSNVKWKPDRKSFTATCPKCNGLLGVSSAAEYCIDGCPKEQIAKYFVNGTTTGSVREPALSNGSSKTSRQTTNGNGYHPPATDLASWKLKLYDHANNLIEKAAAGGRAALLAASRPDDLVESVSNDLKRACADLNPLVLPIPPELTQTDREEEIFKIASAAIGRFENLPTVHTNGNGAVPAPVFELPDLFKAGITIMTGQEIMQRRQTLVRNRTLVDGFLSLKEISLWSGKVEHGKTTLLRTLVMAVLRGESFLGRPCVKSRVLYVMLDADGEEHTIDEFLKLGWNPERDDLQFMFDPIFAMRANALGEFHAKLLQTKPSLVVIDPLGRFQQIKDFNDYGTTYMMANLSELAKVSDCHFALPHHIPRGRSDDADAATAGLGSIVIGGSVNARFVVSKKPGKMFTIKTSAGKGSGFVPLDMEQTISPDPETGWIQLVGPYTWKDQARALKEQVFEVLDRTEEPISSTAIAKELGLIKSACGLAANMLYEDGRISRTGSGKRNNKYLYARLLNVSGSNGTLL